MLNMIKIFRGAIKHQFCINQSNTLNKSVSFSFSEGKKGQTDKPEGKGKNPKQNENKNKKDEKNTKNVENQKGNMKDNKDDKTQGKKGGSVDNKNQAATSKDLQKEEAKKPTLSLKNEKYDITHNYEKKETLTQSQKQQLQNIVTKMLQDDGITAVKAEEIKQEIRNPLNNAYARYLNKIDSSLEAFKNINNFTDYFFYKRTFEALDRLVRYKREISDLKDPAYIQIRFQNKLVYNGDIKYPTDPQTDIRQNVNSKNWLKEQPRLSEVEYAYNIEGNKEFHKKFPQFVQEDKKATLEKKKLMKYMKLHPDNQQVRLRFIPRNLPVGITPEKIPDFDVDISGYKLAITKKSRRKFDRPRVDTNFKNYEAWRCFDRVFMAFSEEMDFIRVNLIPKNLINRFSVPCSPQHEDITGQYYFEDENLDVFMVCDFKQTDESSGPIFNEEFYKQLEYEKVSNQYLPDYKKNPLPQEFWECTELKEFRIYYNRYSEVKKFKRWLQVYANYFDPAKDKTMDQILDEKFGKFDNYSDYTMERKNKTVPAIYNYTPQYFMETNEKRIVEHDPMVFPKYISPKDGEFFDYEEMLREDAAKGVKKDKEEMV